MFSYNVAKKADRKAFDKTCSAIESQFGGIEKEGVLVDVDGTQIQIYRRGTSKIKVFNDYDVDAVYVDSDIDLSQIL